MIFCWCCSRRHGKGRETSPVIFLVVTLHMGRRRDFSSVTYGHETIGICRIPLNVAIILQRPQ